MPTLTGKSYGRHDEETKCRNASNDCPSYCSAMIWVPMSCLVLACVEECLTLIYSQL